MKVDEEDLALNINGTSDFYGKKANRNLNILKGYFQRFRTSLKVNTTVRMPKNWNEPRFRVETFETVFE